MSPETPRLAILGAGGAHRTEASLVRAAGSLGIAARGFDALGWHRRLGRLGAGWVAHRIEAFRPTLVICTRHATRLGGAHLERLASACDTVLWYFDAMPRPAVAELARRVGHTFATSQAAGAWLASEGVANVGFLPQAADPELDRPAASAPAAFHCDLSFIGSGNYPHRWPILERLAGECRMQIRGPGWDAAPPGLPVVGGPVRGARFARAVAGAKVSLGANALPVQDSDPASSSNRLWKVLACGGAYLGQRVPGAEALATDGEHCRWYRDADEASDLLRELLADPNGRHAMAHRGREHVLANHTYAHRLRTLLERVASGQTRV